jgi:hypothetical protein
MKFVLLSLSVAAAGAVASGRFINQAGAYPAAGGLPIGCAACDGEAGDLIPVDVIGVTDAVAGAAIVKDAPLMLDAAGKVVTHDGAAGKHAVGRAMQAAAADGDVIEILLAIPAGDADAVV